MTPRVGTRQGLTEGSAGPLRLEGAGHTPPERSALPGAVPPLACLTWPNAFLHGGLMWAGLLSEHTSAGSSGTCSPMFTAAAAAANAERAHRSTGCKMLRVCYVWTTTQRQKERDLAVCKLADGARRYYAT